MVTVSLSSNVAYRKLIASNDVRTKGRNDVINRQEYYEIPHMLAKTLVECSNEMDSARAILQLQKSASEEELLATLQCLKVQRLKFLCKELAVKSSGIKAEIVGRLITN